MDPNVRQELQVLTKRIAARPTKIIGTREMREKLASYLDGVQDTNVVILDHGTPRAAVLDYETYDALLHLARLVTFEVADDAVQEPTEEEWQAMEARRRQRASRRRQLV